MALVGLVVLGAVVGGVFALRAGGDAGATPEASADATPPDASSDGASDVELRCEQLEYPCTWDQVSMEVFEATVRLHDELATVMDDAEGPPEAMEAAEAILADRDDLAEWGVDGDGFAGVMFRIDGGAPAILMTQAAAGIATGDPPELSSVDVLDWTPPDPAALVDGQAVVEDAGHLGERGEGPPVVSGAALGVESLRQQHAHPARYRPAGGPIEPKRALVLDPYPREEWCSETKEVEVFLSLVESGLCRVSRDGQTEGELVAGILAAHPQIQVTHLTLEDVTLAALASAGDYDIVHLVSHGSRVCGDELRARRQDFADLDYSGCFGAIALGERPSATDSLQADVHAAKAVYDGLDFAGVSYNGTRWVVTADFFNQIGGLGDSILYLSACTSADGMVDPSRFGGFVGWRNYVELNGALQSAAAFWQMMVQRGAEFDLTHQHLVDRGLDSTTARTTGMDLNELMDGHTATMVAESSDNLRARDVITHAFERVLTLDRGSAGGSGVDRVRKVEMLVEGVADGSEDDVEIRMFVDDEELPERLNIADDGRRLSGAEGVSNWMVVGENLELPFGIDPTQEYEWESRVYEDDTLYSADRDPVVFTSLRLLFESAYEQVIDGIEVLMTVEAEIPLAPDGDDQGVFEALGDGDELELTEFDLRHPSTACSEISASGKGTLDVPRVADLPGPLDRPDQAVLQPPSATVVYQPSTDLDTDISVTCQGVHYDSLEDAVAGFMGVPRGPIEGLEGMNPPGGGLAIPGFAGMTWYTGFSFLNVDAFDGQRFTAASGPDVASDSPWEWARDADGDAALERVHVGQMPEAGLTVTTTMTLEGFYPDVPPLLPDAPPSNGDPGV